MLCRHCHTRNVNRPRGLCWGCRCEGRGEVIAYQCSGPDCGYLHGADPHGHCPRCKKPDGSGYPTVPVEALPCDYCGRPRLPGAPWGRCDDCLAADEYAAGTH
jgi:hypothetical protein